MKIILISYPLKWTVITIIERFPLILAKKETNNRDHMRNATCRLWSNTRRSPVVPPQWVFSFSWSRPLVLLFQNLHWTNSSASGNNALRVSIQPRPRAQGVGPQRSAVSKQVSNAIALISLTALSANKGSQTSDTKTHRRLNQSHWGTAVFFWLPKIRLNLMSWW